MRIVRGGEAKRLRRAARERVGVDRVERDQRELALVVHHGRDRREPRADRATEPGLELVERGRDRRGARNVDPRGAGVERADVLREHDGRRAGVDGAAGLADVLGVGQPERDDRAHLGPRTAIGTRARIGVRARGGRGRGALGVPREVRHVG